MGLSPDGRFLIVAADDGEQLALPADGRLRAAVHGDRPRLGQLEIEMESALTPREIQSRIRSGESLEDVAKVAGIELERVERFAAPVIAEREYVAGQALAASVRRRGETSGHRNLRLTITERLTGRGVDADSLVWDSFRQEDGRWSVTADYRSGAAERRALFVYDARARFSVAGNDDARWILGEQTAARGPQPGRRRPDGSAMPEDGDVEPTLDLSDELAIVRAVQEPPPAPAAALAEAADLARAAESAEAEQLAPVQQLRPVVQAPAAGEPQDALSPEATEDDDLTPGALESDRAESDRAESDRAESDDEPALASRSAVDLDRLARDVLDDVLGIGLAEESATAYAGLSDAIAVPDAVTGRGAGWEPAIVVDYPVEPSQVEPADEYGDELVGTDEPGPPYPATSVEDRVDEADAADDEDVALDLEAIVAQAVRASDTLPQHGREHAADHDADRGAETGADEPTETLDEAPAPIESDPAATRTGDIDVVDPEAAEHAEAGEPEAGEQAAADVPVDGPATVVAARPPASESYEDTAGPAVDATPPDDQEAAAEPEQPAEPAPAKPGRRKRASVPSWDEIMFGAPKKS